MNIKRDNPYSIFKKVQAYLFFLLNSKNRHGVHSPFVYDFIQNVLSKNSPINEIEIERAKLKKDDSIIVFKDYGQRDDRNSSVSTIAKKSLKRSKEAAIIAQIVKYYKVDKVIEMGTSLGITTAYIAKCNPSIPIQTIEANKDVLAIAEKNWQSLSISNITSFHSSFDEILPTIIEDKTKSCLYFIDGNHRFEATKKYFDLIAQKSNDQTIMIFDDIHWSKGMEEAWREIIKDDRVSLSIDLFEFGVVFFNLRLQKEHFIIRY